MSTIDIRFGNPAPIDRIQFADEGDSPCYVTRLASGKVIAEDSDKGGYEYKNIQIKNVDNYVKAVAKARELGWDI